MEVQQLTTSVREVSMRINERIDTLPIKEDPHIKVQKERLSVQQDKILIHFDYQVS